MSCLRAHTTGIFLLTWATVPSKFPAHRSYYIHQSALRANVVRIYFALIGSLRHIIIWYDHSQGSMDETWAKCRRRPFAIQLGVIASCHLSIVQWPPYAALPSLNEATAHFPVHAHVRALVFRSPPCSRWTSSSWPLAKPTTTSALQVRKAKVRTPDPSPRGPIAWEYEVVGSHFTLQSDVSLWSCLKLPVWSNDKECHTSPVSFR